jgi:hypothetical protein
MIYFFSSSHYSFCNYYFIATIFYLMNRNADKKIVFFLNALFNKNTSLAMK